MMKVEDRYYKWNEIAEIPPNAGIYAWYLPLHITGTVLKDAEEFQEHLSAYANILKRPEATLRLKGNLSSMQVGEIKQIPYGEGKHGFSTLLKEKIDEEDSRTVLAGILNAISFTEGGAPTVLSERPGGLLSPLYIGVAADLHNRIKTHRKGIIDASDDLSKAKSYADISEEDEDRESDEDERGKLFAGRIAVRLSETNHFTRRHLIVYVMPIQTTLEKDDGALRKTIEAAETLLNRIHYPPFGRR